MIEKRPFSSLGGASHGWLNAKHHFSFAGYRDPNRMGWGSIRVWNDDEIAPGTGFDPHSHSNMEIITYVRDGAITHEDNKGNKGRTESGDVQVMSAGYGITHSEYNRESVLTRIFQIWVFPDKDNIEPNWGAKPFPKSDRAGAFVTLASGFADDSGALHINAPARLAGATLLAGQSTLYTPIPRPEGAAGHIYLVVASGRVTVNGIDLGPRDGAAITEEADLVIEGLEAAEVLLVDAN